MNRRYERDGKERVVGVERFGARRRQAGDDKGSCG